MRDAPFLLFVFFAVVVASVAQGDEPRHKKVLLIGIDGCRFDALLYSQAKHLKRLMREGAYSDTTDVLGDRKTRALTITGPGWTSALSGVWADKHGVVDNSFRDEKICDYPSFLYRVQQARPKASLAALVSWEPFQKHIFAGLKGCRFVVDGDKKGYGEGDRQVTEAAVLQLSNHDPDVLFVYFGQVDITGHGYGFHPQSPKYTNAIELVDQQVGRILAALAQRKNYAREDWLTIVCTDHGGRGREHGAGKDVPEIRTVFLILHGRSVRPGRIKDRTFNVDVAATALTHLDVAIRPEWKLDGRPVGLKSLTKSKEKKVAPHAP